MGMSRKLSNSTVAELKDRLDMIDPNTMGLSPEEWAEDGWAIVSAHIQRVLDNPTVETLASAPHAVDELQNNLGMDHFLTDGGRLNADGRRIEADLLRASNDPDDRYDPSAVCTHRRRTRMVDGIRYYCS